MAIDNIQNREIASSVRDKLNQTIGACNDLDDRVDVIDEMLGQKADKGVDGKVPGSQLPPLMGNWQKIFEKTTAGAFTWTAPNLFDNKSYKIGILLIGGGGGGRLTYDSGASGGASGYLYTEVIEVTPNQDIIGVVGAGGGNGSTGGATSFNGRTALGGQGGKYITDTQSSAADGALGGQNSLPYSAIWDYTLRRANMFGGMMATYLAGSAPRTLTGVPFNTRTCFNPYEMKLILGAGGGVYPSIGTAYYSLGGKDPKTNLGGGDGGINNNGGDATAPGCGGGSAYPAGRTPGKGADGAVYIYILEVSA